MVCRGDANGGELGGVLTHPVEGNRVGRVIITKIIVEFSYYFFIGRSAKLNITLTHNPWPAPSRGSQGWGGLIHHRYADVVANGTTMVNVFVEWSTALVSCQSLLFLREET